MNTLRLIRVIREIRGHSCDCSDDGYADSRTHFCVCRMLKGVSGHKECKDLRECHRLTFQDSVILLWSLRSLWQMTDSIHEHELVAIEQRQA